MQSRRSNPAQGSASVTPEPPKKSSAVASPFTRYNEPTTSLRSKQTFCWIAVILGVILLINYNASRMGARAATGLGSAKTQGAVSSKGYSDLASGGRITTAAAAQGSNQCVSTYKVPPDTPTAVCQAFCNVKFKKFHCMWCKCRACEFCAKGVEAIEEAAKDASPPPPPEASFVFENLEHNMTGAPPSNASAPATSDEKATRITVNGSVAGPSTTATASIAEAQSTEQLLVAPASDAAPVTTTAESTGNALSILLQTDASAVDGIKDPVLAAAAAAVDTPSTTTITVATPAAEATLPTEASTAESATLSEAAAPATTLSTEATAAAETATAETAGAEAAPGEEQVTAATDGLLGQETINEEDLKDPLAQTGADGLSSPLGA